MFEIKLYPQHSQHEFFTQAHAWVQAQRKEIDEAWDVYAKAGRLESLAYEGEGNTKHYQTLKEATDQAYKTYVALEDALLDATGGVEITKQGRVIILTLKGPLTPTQKAWRDEARALARAHHEAREAAERHKAYSLAARARVQIRVA